MQGLHPLTVHDVTLAPGDALEGGRADEAALEATGFEFLEQRNPVGSAAGEVPT
jgi:hypothetical protein